MSKYLVFLFLMLSLSSCAIYKTEFSCLPSPMGSCCSITELESMVEESEIGPDHLQPDGIHEPCILGATKHQLRLWIPDQMQETGEMVASHYVYAPKDPLQALQQMQVTHVQPDR